MLSRWVSGAQQVGLQVARMSTDIAQPSGAVDNMVVVPAYNGALPQGALHEPRRPRLRPQPMHRPSHTRRHFVQWHPGCLAGGRDDEDGTTTCAQHQQEAGMRGQSPIFGLRTLPKVPPPLRTPVLTRMAALGSDVDVADESCGDDVYGEFTEEMFKPPRPPDLDHAGRRDRDDRRRARLRHREEAPPVDVAKIVLAAGIGVAVAAVCTAVVAAAV